MWVRGDLKDRLGIQHRKDLKNSKGKLENAPMFHHPHARSESETSAFHHDVEIGAPVKRPATVPPSPGSSSNNSATPLPSTHHDPSDDLTSTARMNLTASPASYVGSYYSASAIPVASPVPSSRPGSGSPPTMTSLASFPVSSSSTLQVPQVRSLQPSPSSRPPEAYEMHVRSPEPENTPHARETTDATYATAYDGVEDGELTPGPHHQQEESWRSSTYSYSGPHAI